MMDLKSMLNDAAAQRPLQLHTSQSTFEGQNAPANEAYQSHPPSHKSPSQAIDSRGQAGSQVEFRSPHQTNLTSASTSAGSHSVYIQSPGPHSQQYVSRENNGAHYPYNSSVVVQSASTPAHQPPTPGGSHHYQSHTPGSVHSQQSQPSYYAQSQSPHGSNPANGHEQSQIRQLSPHAQIQQQQPPHQYPHPQTPLGPPAAYNKISPQIQRPPSQGVDQHYRKSSYGSTGSGHGRDNAHGHPTPEPVRAQSVQRRSISEADRVRERDRSLSVSPKTIPKPSPYRQMSSTSIGSHHSQQEPRSVNVSHYQSENVPEMVHLTSTPKSSAGSVEPGRVSRGQSVGPNSSNVVYAQSKSTATNSPLSAHPELPSTRPLPNLKRNASLMSDGSSIVQQPQKRLRRDEIPHWAQSARKRPPRFGDGSKKARFAPALSTVPHTISRAVEPPAVNGHIVAEHNIVEHHGASETRWEPTIANLVPEDDLCTAISRWIYSHIGSKVPPPGAVFEIEAKVGAICDTHTGERIRLPVRSETITAIDLPHTKFESSMDMEQHQTLNQYLNNLAQVAYNDPNREPVRPRHLRQFDDFFELTPEGLNHLNPALLSGKGRRMRVRKTTDKDTGQVREMIVKVRLDDLEVYNPVHDFDYRISISIESPWEGDPAWLIPIQNMNARTRLKDRMSYRHGAIQVDLTQVSHEDSQQMEHELEVEVSVATLQAELEKERTGLPNRFNNLVKSLVDNARLLCRQGSLYRRK